MSHVLRVAEMIRLSALGLCTWWAPCTIQLVALAQSATLCGKSIPHRAAASLYLETAGTGGSPAPLSGLFQQLITFAQKFVHEPET